MYLAGKAATHMKYCEHAGLAVSITQKRVEYVKIDSNPTYEVPPFDYTKMGELKNLIHQSWKDDVVTASDLESSSSDGGSSSSDGKFRAATVRLQGTMRHGRRRWERQPATMNRRR